MKNILIFLKAFRNTKHEMFISMLIVLGTTFLLSAIFYVAESIAQPEVFSSYPDALVWAYTRYIEGGDGVFEGSPVTIIGRIIAFLLGFVGIAIVAIPAGLIGSGFIDAIAEDKREEELVHLRKRLRKKFSRTPSKTLREYLDSLPDKGGNRYKVLNFVHKNRPLSTLQMQMGVSLQDLFDVAKKFPEFRIHNLATARSSEENTNDSFVMEHYPVNRPYGCCIDRNSDVTIVSTSSYDENGTGWWTYYLAQLGGFNYISKDMEVDMDDLDSFFNWSKEPTFEKKEQNEYAKGDEGYDVIEKKKERRKAFMDDIHNMIDGKDNPWVFVACASIKNKDNTVDMHIATNNRKNDKSTIHDTQTYNKLFNSFKDLFESMNMECVKTQRYPLLQKNLVYRIHGQEDIHCNGVVLRPSSEIINFDNRSELIIFRLAEVMSQCLGTSGILDQDLLEMKPGYGYNK